MDIKPQNDGAQTARVTIDPGSRVLEALCIAAVGWLFFVGTWSGPWWGATLAYHNGLPAVEAGLAFVLMLQARRGALRPLRDYPFLWPCAGALAIFALAAALRMYTQHLPFDALRLWCYGEPMLRGLLLYLAIAGQHRVARVAFCAMMAGMLLLAAAAILQHILGDTRWYLDLDGGWASGFIHKRGHRAQGLTSYINLTAVMLAAASAYAIIPPILRVPRTPATRVALLAAGLPLLMGLWNTGSRGPLLALMLVGCLFFVNLSLRWGLSALLTMGCFLAVVWPLKQLWALGAFIAALALGIFMRERHRRYLLPIVLALGFSGGLLVLDAYILHLPLEWRVSERGVADTERLALNMLAVHATFSAPLWGIGDEPLGTRVTHLRYLNNLPHVQQNAHNQYLQWAAANGLPVALAFTLLVCWAVCWCWRSVTAETPPFARALGLSTVAALSIFLLANLVDAQLWRIEGGGFFWSLLALATAVLRG